MPYNANIYLLDPNLDTDLVEPLEDLNPVNQIDSPHKAKWMVETVQAGAGTMHYAYFETEVGAMAAIKTYVAYWLRQKELRVKTLYPDGAVFEFNNMNPVYINLHELRVEED